ncbi:4-aminobutyrate aminotransferase [Thraustotheca clavata]|uniref:4-aminobutyrate aminotransferase n=1 Tax=Thraustotheca clavata TaxID=74557 RepID=A0A1W0A2U5_9STRA|nr:4-aminobutyrate aminotransferase [Thraustotheca clavata]
MSSKQSIARGIGRLSDMVLAKGKGSYVWNTEGKKLLDFTCGIGVTNVGHCHPKVTDAVQKQAATLVHGQVGVAYHQPMLEYVDKLLPHLPKTLDSLFFASTGAEGVENAVKLARQATGRPNIIVMQGGYHGRTLGTMSMTTSKTVYSAGFGPLLSGIHPVPFPYTLHMPGDEAANIAYCLQEIELCLKQRTTPKETAAILIEPIMGEGGYLPVPKAYMQGLRRICDAHGILLIADEVQCGFGRTGTMFAVDGMLDVTPDILVMAKGIANGFPLSGIASRRELMDKQPAGSMGGTYAGNAVAMAAASAVLDVFQEESILANTRARGEQLMTGLNNLKNKYPILDVRGAGLMVALEFDSTVAPGTSGKVCATCVDKGMLLLSTSVYETLRFIPPLNVSAEEMQEGLDILDAALADVFGEQPIAQVA